ncbi:MAG: hypothetical protein HY343_06350 [Lentisphaerae bacterium]|nr:hypothetical protein [Lentisphaerota bacterium]
MKVVLIGDSIRMGYQPLVAKKCPEAEVWGPAENCRHSVCVLEHFKEWVADQAPDVVHVNFGIHDANYRPDGKPQIVLPQYRLSLQRFIDRVGQLGNTKMIWATTTPLYTPVKGKPMEQWPVSATAEIADYNAAALEIVKGRGLPVNDLHDVVVRNGFAKCLCEDGCHMTAFGNEALSDAVVKAIRAV